jgi:hypothetical protein
MRFALDLPVRFRTAGRGRKESEGAGRVVDISSHGLAFRTETELPAGVSIRASFPWPVTLGGEAKLQLSVEGRVLRRSGDLAVMSMLRHEFRTCGRISPQGEAAPAAATRALGMLLSAPATVKSQRGVEIGR